MIYLDTHVIIWLHQGKIERLSSTVRHLIERDTPRIAPIVMLELEYLHEAGRVRERAAHVIAHLADRVGLIVCDRDPVRVSARACDLAWTLDVFDRIIVAHAAAGQDTLLTRHETILANYSKARW